MVIRFALEVIPTMFGVLGCVPHPGIWPSDKSFGPLGVAPT